MYPSHNSVEQMVLMLGLGKDENVMQTQAP